MQAVILAAGNGIRMRPLTYDIPKPMLPLKGKPIIEYTLSFLPSCIDEVVIVINYLGTHIKKHCGNSYQGKPIRYVFQKTLNGTGGALHSCKNVLKDKFMVVMGDDLYYREDLEKMCSENFVILAYEVDDPSRFGVFRINSQGHLVDIIENPKTKEHRLVNTGAYVINKNFFGYPLVPKERGSNEFGLPQTLVNMAKDHKIKILRATHWHPIGKPEDLQKAEKVLSQFLF